MEELAVPLPQQLLPVILLFPRCPLNGMVVEMEEAAGEQ